MSSSRRICRDAPSLRRLEVSTEYRGKEEDKEVVVGLGSEPIEPVRDYLPFRSGRSSSARICNRPETGRASSWTVMEESRLVKATPILDQ